MQKIHSGHEKAGNAQEKQKVIVQKLPGIPGNKKNGTGDNNAENLGQAVKKKIVLNAGQIQAKDRQSAQDNVSAV